MVHLFRVHWHKPPFGENQIQLFGRSQQRRHAGWDAIRKTLWARAEMQGGALAGSVEGRLLPTLMTTILELYWNFNDLMAGIHGFSPAA